MSGRIKLVCVGAALGVLAGGAGALAERSAGDPALQGSAVRAAPGRADVSLGPPPRRPPGRLADGRYDPSHVHRVVRRGTVRVAVRLPDPAGGLPWAVRTFDAELRSLTRPARSLRGSRSLGTERCAELGRLSGARFGWVFPGGRFAPSFLPDALITCRRPGDRSPEVAFTAQLAFRSPSAPRVVQTAIWGVAPGARSARAVGLPPGAPPALRLGAGAFLALGGPEASARRGHVAFSLRGGRTARVRLSGRALRSRSALRRNRRDRFTFPAPVPGSETVEARAPDPAGGPARGVPVVDTKDGGTCAGMAGQVVGERVGLVDTEYGLLGEIGAVECRPRETRPTLDRPIDMISGAASADGLLGRPNPIERRAFVERRIQGGRFFIQVECHPAVRQITIRTPRDVRTLVPSPRGRVAYALFDGDFPAGEATVTAKLEGDRTYTERLSVGGF